MGGLRETCRLEGALAARAAPCGVTRVAGASQAVGAVPRRGATRSQTDRRK